MDVQSDLVKHFQRDINCLTEEVQPTLISSIFLGQKFKKEGIAIIGQRFLHFPNKRGTYAFSFPASYNEAIDKSGGRQN